MSYTAYFSLRAGEKKFFFLNYACTGWMGVYGGPLSNFPFKFSL